MIARKSKRAKTSKPAQLPTDTECTVLRGDLLAYRDDVADALGWLLDLLTVLEPLGAAEPDATIYVTGALKKLRPVQSWLETEARHTPREREAGGAS